MKKILLSATVLLAFSIMAFNDQYTPDLERQEHDSTIKQTKII